MGTKTRTKRETNKKGSGATQHSNRSSSVDHKNKASQDKQKGTPLKKENLDGKKKNSVDKHTGSPKSKSDGEISSATQDSEVDQSPKRTSRDSVDHNKKASRDKQKPTKSKINKHSSLFSRSSWFVILTALAVAVLAGGAYYFSTHQLNLSDQLNRYRRRDGRPSSLGGMPLGAPLSWPHTERQEVVVEAFKHAWKAYRDHAWGKDELRPISREGSEWFKLGLTLVDSLDTMWLMGLQEEYEEGRRWVEEEMVVGVDKDVNLFETTIRVLGGLLSTYHLTGDRLFYERAKELGDRLLPCFESKSKIPFSDINLMTGHSHAPEWGPDSSVSEVSTIQLEFRDLTMVTGEPQYQRAVDEVLEKLQSLPKKSNLVPLFINAETGQFRPGTLTLGARADTYYEYIFKQWIQSSKTESKFQKWFLDSMSGMKRRLLRYSRPNGLTFIGEETEKGDFYPKMDHLVCYLPGTLALAVHNGLSQNFIHLAKNLMYTCYQMYRTMPTHLSPEIIHFNMDESSTQDMYVKPLDRHNLLRPETVESLFYMYRLTNNKKYQKWGWNILTAFNQYTRVPGGGYSSINDVTNTSNPQFRDKMESFFLGETLKYLFLLFSNDSRVVSLDHWVINTEAHLLPIWDGYYWETTNPTKTDNK